MHKELEGAVAALMSRLRDAWERGDGEAYGAPFAEDAQYVTATGKRLHGRRAISESHQRIFDTFFRGTTLGRDYPIGMHEIRPDVILVEAAGSVLFQGEKERSVAPNGLMTLVVAKDDAAWRIVSFQNTPTGRFRNLRFMWRYALSRLSAFRVECSKARRHMLEEKQRNMAKWDRNSKC